VNETTQLIAVPYDYRNTVFCILATFGYKECLPIVLIQGNTDSILENRALQHKMSDPEVTLTPDSANTDNTIPMQIRGVSHYSDPTHHRGHSFVKFSIITLWPSDLDLV